MESFQFGVCVLGGGSAGYAAARTLAASSVKTVVVDGGREMGGLCILRGCMPTKALLHAAKLRQHFREAEAWGITAGSVQIDLAKLYARKNELIESFASYRRDQLTSGRFEFRRTTAHFLDPHTLALGDGQTLTARSFIIATGSDLYEPPIPGLAELGSLNSDRAMHLTELPESLIVLGGGAVGTEFAQLFARLGTRVTLLQRFRHLLRSADEDVAYALEAGLRREGLKILTDTRLIGIERNGRLKRVRFQKNGEECVEEAAEVFNALGRRPATSGLQLAAAGVTVDAVGRIQTDLQQRTSVPHIFAAGDCCGPHEVVHVAIQQGEVAARSILGRPAAMDYRTLLQVLFTDPAVAIAGLTEREARERGQPFLSASYPFNDHGKSLILGTEDGFVKLLADPRSGELIGGACVGPESGELIHEISVALSARLTAGQLASVPHYHPTLGEIWTYPAEALAEQVSEYRRAASSASSP